MSTILTTARLILEDEVVTGTIAFDESGVTFRYKDYRRDEAFVRLLAPSGDPSTAFRTRRPLP